MQSGDASRSLCAGAPACLTRRIRATRIGSRDRIARADAGKEAVVGAINVAPGNDMKPEIVAIPVADDAAPEHARTGLRS